ncbi:MAG: arylsulfatase [Calditrichaeota bacterium]|nr:arylsulfatase [Calditrichota bacterium]MCB0290354.1 arylsulfatase [Calditrichota bacterium]MCB0294987.1 arylsulfatase [Calditrichota bacterium]MCB0304718.1 arylsulfatase [Calditrichota bacterium]
MNIMLPFINQKIGRIRWRISKLDSMLALLTMLCILALLGNPLFAQERPNFLVIVADDMGYSDMGMFGGEISTPNLDALAQQGVRYTNYYVAPTCSPTRAMLMSGMDNHLAGMGNMYERIAPNQEGQPGYEGVLNHQIAPLPAILKANGYHTYMAGKWHLGKSPEHIPAARGFERDFTLLDAAGAHFSRKPYDDANDETQFTADGKYIDKLPKGYYSSKTFTDKMIEFIESNRGDGKPFFAYMAHQAPHDPLQVPDDWLRKYKGRYDAGWDKIREQRLARMKEMNLIPEIAENAHRIWYVPDWDELTGMAQVTLARKMEIYAAMVEYLDMEIGKLVDYLRDTDQLDNTYIIFFSDNGPESNDKVSNVKGKKASAFANWLAKTYDTDFASWGRKGSFVAYGPPWAQVSATPFWMFKGTMNEGGIRSPLVIVDPKHTNAGSINHHALLHVKDLAPTLLDLANIEPPRQFNGHDVLPMQGASWADMIGGKTPSPRTEDDWLAFEFWHCMTVRKGDWKLTWMPKPVGKDDWRLVNLARDPGERHDLSAENPGKVKELLAHWESYVAENNVILPNRTQYDGLEEKLPPRPPVDGSWPPGPELNYGGEESEDD